jgi:predicted dehydrogenase
MSIRFAVIGIDHRHAYGMTEHLIAAGATCAGWWTEGHPGTEAGFVKRFPDLPRVERWQDLLEDPDLHLVVIAAVPRDRSGLAVQAMRAGKDVMTDKPGCTTPEQLAELRRVQGETGRIWSVDFSERFEVPSVTRAQDLVEDGAIGRVVQTVGLGPHRLNRATRPAWFFERDAYGGILTDIASHQIDQFLHFTGSDGAEIVHAAVENYAHPGDPGLQDFGEIALRSDRGRGYIRVDWFTPDALPNWGDGRLTILGTEGYIELRKYVDVAGRAGTDTLILVNGARCEVIDARDDGLPYFPRMIADVQDRTETAMRQAHCFTVMELALEAQAMAEGAA